MGSLKDNIVAVALVLVGLITIGWGVYSYLSGSPQQDYITQDEQALSQEKQVADETGREAASGIPGCTCHSKNPAMVRMHDELGGTNCGLCHRKNENLMDPDRAPTQPEDIKRRIKEENICGDCHLEDGSVVSSADKNKTKISGALFCPKCKKQISTKDTSCPECGGKVVKEGSGWRCTSCGPLVDVDKVAALSKEKPSNEICKLCHFDDHELGFQHSGVEGYNKRKENVPGGLSNCLACHESHNQCGGCHF